MGHAVEVDPGDAVGRKCLLSPLEALSYEAANLQLVIEAEAPRTHDRNRKEAA